MSKNEQQLTSVKVDTELFNEFKVNCIRYKFSLSKLVNRAMDLYISDEDFRKQLNNHRDLNFDKEE